VHGTSGVMCLNPVQNLSEIEQSVAELLTISHISPSNFRGWALSPGGSQGHMDRELHQTWRGHRASSPRNKSVSAFRYLAAFSNAGNVENEAKFRTFAPAPVKITGGVCEISGSINQALPTNDQQV